MSRRRVRRMKAAKPTRASQEAGVRSLRLVLAGVAVAMILLMGAIVLAVDSLSGPSVPPADGRSVHP